MVRAALGILMAIERSDGGDAARLDENGLVELRRAAGGIDEGDVCDSKLGGRFRRKERRNDEERGQQEEKYLS